VSAVAAKEAVRERPIIFSGAMVRAILAGTKTQTRRIVKPQPAWTDISPALLARCPYGTPGDRLWVRETWRTMEREEDMVDGVRFLADAAFVPIENTRQAADAWVAAHANGKHGVSFRPSIHMPRWASRIDLEITRVRIQRLQEISEEDARAEGVDELEVKVTEVNGKPAGGGIVLDAPRVRFCALWKHINGSDSWPSNPVVWVLDFKRVRP